MAQIGEAKVAEGAKAWLEQAGWTVYSEVSMGQGSSRADLVGSIGPSHKLLSVVEAKTSLSLEVLEQASAWTAHFRWVAVPQGKVARNNGTFGVRVAKWLGVGVLEVQWAGTEYARDPIDNKWVKVPDRLVCRVVLDAPIQRWGGRPDAIARLRARLHEGQRTAKAGGTPGGGYWTPYRETMGLVKAKLVQAGPAGLDIGGIMADLKHHYASSASAKASLAARLADAETSWCVIVGQGKAARYSVREGVKVDVEQ